MMIEQFPSDYQSQIEALQWWHVALGYLFVSVVDSLVDSRLNAMKEKAVAEAEREQSEISDEISGRMLFVLIKTAEYTWPDYDEFGYRFAYLNSLSVAHMDKRSAL
ncbi:hypothetical protein NTH51_002239 [Vibrio fluvialis]|nr:hypothetical protein [Vibrio fluvialis]